MEQQVDLREQLITLEQDFWEAGGDPAPYVQHFAEDGRCVFPMGILDKASTVSSIELSEPWLDVTLGDVELLSLGDDVAALVYSASARRRPDEPAYETNVSSVYQRRDGAWMLTLHQHSPVS